MTLDKTATLQYYPKWVRGFDIITGIVAVTVGFWIILDTSLAQLSVLFLLALALLLIGFARIVKVATTSDEVMKSSSRVFNAVTGVVAIIAASYVFLFPLLTLLLTVAILGVALMVSGVTRLLMGVVEEELPLWARALLVIVGLLTIGLSLIAIAFPGYGFVVLTVILAFIFITNGFTRLVSGVTGRY
ncbi:MAG: hypothetical protein ThorAB25_18690 [Candidatus Thorarchaeota archaeon AB_25]|nr:MAG: hypothetical protein ThorAB25_18690 [Candidatus Thorarchaeota archaeon AB_25]